jgi:hypothetical protein
MSPTVYLTIGIASVLGEPELMDRLTEGLNRRRHSRAFLVELSSSPNDRQEQAQNENLFASNLPSFSWKSSPLQSSAVKTICLQVAQP